MEERGGTLQVVTVMEERGGAPSGCDSERREGGALQVVTVMEERGGAPSGCDSDGGERRSSFRREEELLQVVTVMGREEELLQVVTVMEERGGALQVVTVMEERGGAPSGCDSDGGERRSSFRLSQ
ncbi:Pecanex-like protein 2 [Dissostichus eleginoides]|uniref:Pecanex-like protein 2 n=1 Tax=Dissostichus eleginoides TaxID=100907 RepID=A0AAD9C7P9_DISEL|nr:Pecanex-like protein 2 [Dissostichus eleginoides]